MTLSKVIESEIADFFAGFCGSGEPDIQSGEAQRQLTERLLSVLALRERAEPVAYISKADLDAGYPHILARKEYSKACPMAVYSAPPASVVPDVDWMKKIYSIFCAPTAGSDNAMVAIHNACCAAMLAQPTKANDVIGQYQGADGMPHDIVTLGRTACKDEPVSNPYKLPEGWIKCSERMPESNKYVLVCNGVWVGMGMYNNAEHFEDCERWQDEHGEFIDLLHHPVTHWMPLPAAPGKEG